MSAPMRRGACPSLPEPMATGDGLLARLALTAPLKPGQLAALARLSQCYGNGIVEVSARGSLQVRGLSPDTAREFAEGIGASGIMVREGLAIEINPLAGRDPSAVLDPRPLALEIARCARPLADRLGPKVSVIVDGGGALPLGGLTADIRLKALAADRLAFEAGGVRLAVVRLETAVATVMQVLELLAAQGLAARMTDLVVRPKTAPSQAGTEPESPDRRGPRAEPVGLHALTDGRFALGLGLAFGQTDGAALSGLAEAAAQSGADGILASFGRALLVTGLTAPAAEAIGNAAEKLGFITDPADPRRSVSACPGRPACASGRIATRALAAELAPFAAGRSLHVSGCAKGCAHPGPADLTIVGLDGGAGLVVEGGPRDTPSLVVPEAGLAGAARGILERHGG